MLATKREIARNPRPTLTGFSPRAADGGEAPHVAAAHGYRTDIDGLRALAVLPILFNHAGVRGFGGGYVGVDVFFVISGFLITGILLRDLEAKRHSIVEFYRRRALRIMPALCAMLLIVTLVSLATLLPGETVRFARSVGATLLFGSNILFLSEAGYFDVASHTKPLLHTWSLAVEEQFYILWPLLLAVIGVHRRLPLRAVLVGVALASLALSVWLVRYDMSAAFYLLPSRAWELAVGGLIAVFPHRIRIRWVNEALAAAALIVLALAVWRFSSVTPFPGLAALVPCLATVAMIFTGPLTLVGRGLSLRPLVFVGLISYSLYLWHWPVIVFAEVWLLLAPTPAVMAGEVAASVVLAILSWRFVETPFRVGGRRWPNRRVLIGAGGAIALGVTAAVAIVLTGGLPGRWSPAQATLARYADMDHQASYRRGTCFLMGAYDQLAPQCLARGAGKPTVLLVGDSEGAHLWPGLSRLSDLYTVQQATVVGCRPGLYDPRTEARCARFFREILIDRAGDRPDLVLLAGRWQTMDLPTIAPLLAALQRRAQAVLMVGPLPEYSVALPRLLVLADYRHDPRLPGRSREEGRPMLDRELRAIARRYGAHYASALDLLCRQDVCRTLAAPGVPLQFDYGHLTPDGSAVVVDMLRPAIDAALRASVRSPPAAVLAVPGGAAGR